MVYAVIDTNVFVSAYLSHNMLSATTKVIDYMFNGRIVLLYNEEILEEYQEVLSRPHLHISPRERDTLFEFIHRKGILLKRTTAAMTFIDEDDRVFYEISLSREGSFLITGNTKHYPHVSKVVTPAQMIEIIDKQKS
ncbi:MAG: putative toxin-antitoxin system toxin component, PIN family [Paludibacteraceae bacterium]|nr:putative toxin-antitoxin system toxin component, PIN family [Paludibacteraceae bacterium]